MARINCLAGIDPAIVPVFSRVLARAGEPALARIARLDVTEIGRIQPNFLVCDVDAIDVDAVEFLRQLRFVLPDCVTAVYTGNAKRSWALACHLAGANALLLKDSDESQLATGVSDVLATGCYTDPRFAA